MNPNEYIQTLECMSYAQSGETLIPGKYQLTLVGSAVRLIASWVRSYDGKPMQCKQPLNLIELIWVVDHCINVDQPINLTNNIIRSRPMSKDVKYSAHPFQQYYNKLSVTNTPTEVLDGLINTPDITMQIQANIGTFISTNINYSIITDVTKARLIKVPDTKRPYNVALIDRGTQIIEKHLKW